jgi:hypothetical protein
MKAREAVGVWIAGLVGSIIIGSAIGWLIWDGARKDKQEMEGGWSRVVTDESLPYWGYAIPTVLILQALWTLAMVAYYLINSGSQK